MSTYECRNGKLTKAFLVMLVFIGIALSVVMNVNAAPYSQKTRVCPSCKKFMSSYGYNPNAVWTTVTENGGNYCTPCGRTLAEDEYHMYLYSSDRYYFRCSHCNYTDSFLYDNPVSEHYTNGVRDY